MKVTVHITLKPGVLDPQGAAIGHALHGLGFETVSNVRQGKFIEFDLPDSEPADARTCVDEMCRKLLANTVIENYSIELA